MKIAFLAVVIMHGLIHVLGFTKAFALHNAKQLMQPISKPMGILWLLAFLLFLTAAILFAFNNSYWWVGGVPAVIISQILIISCWQDAKFGTIANVLILLVAIIGFSSWSYYTAYKKDVETNLLQKEFGEKDLLTETDIQHLPEPVKKYIRYSGSIGKPKVKNFKIEFSGKIRKDEQSNWMHFTSEQYNFIETPTRLFFMNAVMKKLPVAGYHKYKNGIAFMDIRLLSLFKVQFQEGAEMNEAETVTFFNDMCCMAPATLIDKRIVWEETGKYTAKATFTNNGIPIFAELFFNDAGELINFKSNNRFNAEAKQKLPWATPLKNYKRINGYTLPGYAETIYTYSNKDFCYGTFNLISIKYNCHE